ncbi:galactosyltransferase-related protein [Deminuibacter soli]|uniref:Galactosyltransferase C-terminal domain-containing protein n=1 Tax=Deminuibacter soli TaxID=2291815 RepID=A0A3E1NFE1_9BACT|nr:galactosyltransferase-related protein [Deminuibacter soli]RFM26693.1 hypothetical protein DXN05_19185 [Deminuibacter soli]
MLFLSAQPDDYYFTWQLALQLHNFSQVGIAAQNIHVLVAYNPGTGLQNHFRELMEEQRGKACFYTYPDLRKKRNYLSSLRPHIIRQHLEAHPQLQSAFFFYHDSDIIFRELPDFTSMCRDDTWYVSDTRSYLSSTYIQQAGCTTLLHEMCGIVGIPVETVTANDEHCGGAQYVLKNTGPAFWQKIEDDCEAMYGLLEQHNNREAEKFYLATGKGRSSYKGIQAWCADMWALFWNALLLGKTVNIHPGLAFCWPAEPLQQWENTAILHYAGVRGNEKAFDKTRYAHFPPYYDTHLPAIDADTCSSALVDLIRNFNAEAAACRIDLMDVSFLIPVHIDSASRLENLYIVTRYLNKYFNTHILIIESGLQQQTDPQQLPPCCNYEFIENDDILFHRTHINNLLVKKAQTNSIVLFDTDVIPAINQVYGSVQLLRNADADMVYPYDGCFVGVDQLFKNMFAKILDPDLFISNQNKFNTAAMRSCGGAVFLNRKRFIAAGMENEYFKSWGPEDRERLKRMKNLGFSVKRVKGALYHLPHERNINSGYCGSTTQVEYMEEYLKVCNMEKAALEAYVLSWPWLQHCQLNQH